MAVIKFDRDKANTLIRDLNRISTDIESNLRKVQNNTAGKEISLYSSLLKVYETVTVTVQVLQEDGTYKDEEKQEKVLKYDYTSNARTYNNYVRSIMSRSNTASTKATQAIQQVIGALVKLKSLVNEFETDTSLRMANNLDDVGQFDFNFLSAYGPMGGTSNIAALLGAKVAEEAYTSSYLGPLGARPTALNLERLVIFDGILDLVQNNELAYDDKIKGIEGLLMGNVLDVDDEELHSKAMSAYESMMGITSSKDITLDETLKVNFLVDAGVKVVKDLAETEFTTELFGGEGSRDDKDFVLKVAKELFGVKDGESENDGKKTLVEAAIDQANTLYEFATGAKTGSETPKESDWLSSRIENMMNETTVQDKGNSKGSFGAIASAVGAGASAAQKSLVSTIPSKEGAKALLESVKEGVSSNIDNAKTGISDAAQELKDKIIDKFDGDGHGKGGHDDGPKEIHQEEVRIEAKEVAPVTNSSNPNKDVIKHEEIELPQLNSKVELKPEDIKLEEELKAASIDTSYDTSSATSSGTIKDVTIELPSTSEGKGAAVLAGAASVGSLGTLASNSAGGSVPTINGLAAGEMLNMNNSMSNDVMAGGVMSEITGTSASGGAPTVNKVSNTTVGGESTADRGSLSTGGTTEKNSAAKTAAGRGGSTLEDKDQKDNDNSYGKPNKTEDAEDNEKKGMLGDAAIAELNEKDEKQIKMATGVSAGGALGSAVLAFAGVLPSFMFILLLIAIIALYTTYRVKKKHDKKKRMEALAKKQAENVVVEKAVIENVQNVEETVASETSSAGENAIVTEVPASENSSEHVEENATVSDAVQTEVPQTVAPSTSNEFSEQPYEPSRDGVVEIGSNRTES